MNNNITRTILICSGLISLSSSILGCIVLLSIGRINMIKDLISNSSYSPDLFKNIGVGYWIIPSLLCIVSIALIILGFVKKSK